MNESERAAGLSAKLSGIGATSRSTASETKVDELLASLSNTSWQLAMVFTGGGTRMIGQCFARSGASKNFVEASVPYSREAVIDYLGEPQSGPAASIAAAEQLAAKAFARAHHFSGNASSSAGLSLVAALPTMPPRRGSDRVHVSLWTESDGTTWSIELPAGLHTRQSAESVAEQLALLAISTLIECDALSQRLTHHLGDSGIVMNERSNRRDG